MFVSLPRRQQDASEGSGEVRDPARSRLLQSAIPNGKDDGGWRPVIDVSVLNGFIPLTKFRMETVASVLTSIHRGGWMFSVDLKDAYFQIPIHPESRPYLRFCRGPCVPVLSVVLQSFHGSTSFYQSLLWFRRGIRLLHYLDDWLVVSEGHTSPPLLGRLAGCCRVKGTSFSPSGPSFPVVRRSGNCHLAEVGPTAVDLSSVSRHGDSHVPRTGLSFTGPL